MSKPLKDLQQLWYDKIKANGFTDIEYPSGQLKSFSASIHKMEEAKRYFAVCTDFLNSYLFDSDLDKNIWTCHCEGWSRRQIAEILDIGENKVKYRLNKLKLIMEFWRKSWDIAHRIYRLSTRSFIT